ncbi:unnamed protein product [Paramecium sonneborni]|uniref:RING-type domain-containing protein n=1 Tax=Paramecium sonneborni TaxID=65129 RepID=A0A8S1QS79_9CILI|nr:unnamed protein product [Paramecium sonneborni]
MNNQNNIIDDQVLNQINIREKTNLPIKRFYSVKINCQICLDQLTSNEQIFRTNCGDTFHKNCINQYIESNLKERYQELRCPSLRCCNNFMILFKKQKKNYQHHSYLNQDTIINKLIFILVHNWMPQQLEIKKNSLVVQHQDAKIFLLLIKRRNLYFGVNFVIKNIVQDTNQMHIHNSLVKNFRNPKIKKIMKENSRSILKILIVNNVQIAEPGYQRKKGAII